jgi:PAS domain S-box-containing protein
MNMPNSNTSRTEGDLHDQQQRELRQALRETDHFVGAVLAAAPVAIIAVDQNGLIITVNPAAEAMFGYQPGSMNGMSLQTLIPPRLRQVHETHLTQYRAHPKTRPMGKELDLWAYHREGREFPIEVALSPCHTEKGPIVVAVVTDLSARRAEEEDAAKSRMQLRALNERMVKAQEEERGLLAKELHDEVTQTLSFLAVDISRIAGSLHGEEAERLIKLQNKAKEAARSIRRLSHRLHPSILEDLGLEEALRQHCEELSAHEGIPISFAFSELPDVPRDAAFCCYRIAQEALRNACKYSCSPVIHLRVEADGTNLLLTVTDSGVGFDPSAVGQHSLGLISMKERAATVDGRIQIESALGQGTRITLSVPLAR